ncbi:hypothetical protein [Bacillus sp. JJ1562]|uniref:hypothetical protein n=1 Tax=Bacillus sp. JJ1562 TaxID=3122960 RepID=UPI0030016485
MANYMYKLHQLRKKIRSDEAVTQEDLEFAREVATKTGSIESRATYALLKKKVPTQKQNEGDVE